MNNILVFRPGAIGDTLLTFPVLKALREYYGAACITLVGNVQVLPLAVAFGLAEQTYDFQDIHWSELFSSQGIRTSFFRDLLASTDLAICWMRDPDGLIEHNLKTAGIKQVILAPGRLPAGERIYIIDYLARTIGLPDIMSQFVSTTVGGMMDDVCLAGPLSSPVARMYDLHIDKVTSDTVTNPLVAIHPGSGTAEKCWPVSRFAEIINRLWKQNQPVLLLSGPADKSRVEDLLKLLTPSATPEILKLLTSAPLLEVAQYLQLCRCYLGNDSGITHLAAMLGVPTVAIFGPTDPQIWRPIGPSVKVVHEPKLEILSEDVVFEAISSYSCS